MKKWNFSRTETISVLLVAVVGLGIRLYFASKDMEFLIAILLPDDAFYYFVTAKNFIAGNGISFDAISPTNGFHPLWFFIVTPLFGLPGDLPIHLSLFLSAFVDIFTAIIIYRMVKVLLRKMDLVVFPAFMVFVAWIFSPFIIRQTLNGLETSLNAMMFVIASQLAITEFFEEEEKKNTILLALVWGALLLSRTDNLLFWISAILVLFIYKRFELRFFLAFIGGPILVMLPWFIWSFLNFGTIMQSSGVALPQVIRMKYLSEFASEPGNWEITKHSFDVLRQEFRRFLFFAGFSVQSLLSIAFISSISMLFSSKILVSVKSITAKLSFLLLGSILWFIVHGGVRWMARVWYFVPIVFVLWLYIAILLAAAVTSYQHRRWRFANIIFVSVFVFQMWLPVSNLWKQLYSKSWGYTWQVEMVKGAHWLNENANVSENIGSLNSGIVAYFSDAKVINLDGVVNDQIIPYIQKKQICSYASEMNISKIADFRNSWITWDDYWNEGVDPSKSLTPLWASSQQENPYVIYEFSGTCSQ